MKPQTPHPLPTESTSQCNLIHRALHEARGQWIPMLDLHRASGSMAVHSRIAELRRRGHDIKQWSEHIRDPRTGRIRIRSYYRLTNQNLNPDS
jgi:hypothetical protein